MSSRLDNALAQAHTLGSTLLSEAKDEVRDTWDDLRQREVRELADCAKDLGRLVEDHARGKDVTRELAHVKARMAAWTWVGADRVRERWQQWLEQAAEHATKVLKAIGKGLIT